MEWRDWEKDIIPWEASRAVDRTSDLGLVETLSVEYDPEDEEYNEKVEEKINHILDFIQQLEVLEVQYYPEDEYEFLDIFNYIYISITKKEIVRDEKRRWRIAKFFDDVIEKCLFLSENMKDELNVLKNGICVEWDQHTFLDSFENFLIWFINSI